MAQGTALTSATITTHGDTSYATNAIGKAMADHLLQVGKFNAIGNLANASTTSTKTALDTYAYAPYVALSGVEKLAVAEEINKLTKRPAGAPEGIFIPLDFSTGDAVTTLKAANDIIDAAIAKLNAPAQARSFQAQSVEEPTAPAVE